MYTNWNECRGTRTSLCAIYLHGIKGLLVARMSVVLMLISIGTAPTVLRWQTRRADDCAHLRR